MNQSDFTYQVQHVLAAVPRILAQVDIDPLSPTHGCAHPAYWRDKTSEVADMRRQEAMLPLALLFCRPYPGSDRQGQPALLAAVEALLSFWCRHQYPDGSLDEWYKGERAFAAAAFSCHAAARTLDLLGQDLEPDLRRRGLEALGRVAGWLCRREDLFKTNHQAVGVAALAWAAKVLADPLLESNARAKLQAIVASQGPEGWFPEVGHCDPGYTFLTVEFVAMALELWDDWSLLEPFGRAFEFACQWVHPDLTLAEEYGVCHNPYVSRVAAVLLSPFSGQAQYLRQRLGEYSPGFAGLAPTLADDLRLMRWASQPLLAHDYLQALEGKATAAPEPLPLARPTAGWRVCGQAGLARFGLAEAGAGVLAAAAGGALRLLGRQPGSCLAELGLAVDTPQGLYASLTYDRRIPLVLAGDEARVAAPLAQVQKFMPSFAARVALHLLCATAWSSRLTRRAIDVVRRRKGSALNQSSANLAQKDSPWQLSRSVTLAGDRLVLRDGLQGRGPLAPEQVRLLQAQDHGWPRLRPLGELCAIPAGPVGGLTIVRTYVPGPAWSLVDCRVEKGD